MVCVALTYFIAMLCVRVHAVVSGSEGRQECLPPPSAPATCGGGPQTMGHFSSNTGHGMLCIA